MVAPVTGPINKFPTESFADNFRQGYRQAMPLDRPLAYRMYRYYGTRHTTSWTNGVYTSAPPSKDTSWSLNILPDYSRIRTATYNKAYERLRAKVSDQAGWAENLAQINKTRQMVVARAVQLSTFVTALRMGSFGAAARALRSPVSPNVSRSKGVAQNFLEWEYGWKPVVSDLYSSMSILTGTDFGMLTIKGRAKSPLKRDTSTFTQTPTFTARVLDTERGDLHITCYTRLKITNPNLFLANQLGVLDFALPWKLIPFSFVVDWFINMEQVISATSAWYGVSLTHPHVSEFVKGSRYRYFFQNTTHVSGQSSGQESKTVQDALTFDRTMGIPSPTLVVKPFQGFSIQRGAQALALVVAVLTGDRTHSGPRY